MPNHLATATDSQTSPVLRVPLFSRFGVVMLTVGMVAAFFMSQLIGVYAAGRLLLPASDRSSVGDILYFGSSQGTIVSVSIIVSLLILSVLSVSIIYLKGGNSRQYLALKPFSAALGVSMFGLLLVFMGVSQAVTYVLEVTPSAFVDPLYHSVSSVWLLVFVMVIAAPVYEELVFRGILWHAIAEQFSRVTLVAHDTLSVSGAWIASLVTSFIFAIIHVQYGIYEISTIILLALIFCYARFKSGSLWLPIVLHIINNGAAMGLYLSQVA